MPKKNTDDFSGSTDKKACACDAGAEYNIEALLSVDERGQMVLPKDLREKIGIRPGDKLALFTLKKEGTMCCMALMKVDNINMMVKNILGPLGEDLQTK
ncbi:MAG: HgcAB-associated protein [Methanoregula sp.]